MGKTIQTTKPDKVAWSIAPLWIRKSVRKIAEEYLAFSGVTRNKYLVDLIEKDVQRMRAETDRLKKLYKEE
jgi:hypothetical protein